MCSRQRRKKWKTVHSCSSKVSARIRQSLGKPKCLRAIWFRGTPCWVSKKNLFIIKLIILPISGDPNDQHAYIIYVPTPARLYESAQSLYNRRFKTGLPNPTTLNDKMVRQRRQWFVRDIHKTGDIRSTCTIIMLWFDDYFK